MSIRHIEADGVTLRCAVSGPQGAPWLTFAHSLATDMDLWLPQLKAFSENYRVAVVEEGCFDRFWTSHAISLCDVHAKYGDVIDIEEAVEFIGALPDDLFDLPSGTAV